MPSETFINVQTKLLFAVPDKPATCGLCNRVPHEGKMLCAEITVGREPREVIGVYCEQCGKKILATADDLKNNTGEFA